MILLTTKEIATRCEALPTWQLAEGALLKTYVLADFVHALLFVNALGHLAEQVGHHPNIEIRYNKVTLTLTTYSAGGLTQRDFDLAQQIETLLNHESKEANP